MSNAFAAEPPAEELEHWRLLARYDKHLTVDGSAARWRVVLAREHEPGKVATPVNHSWLRSRWWEKAEETRIEPAEGGAAWQQ